MAKKVDEMVESANAQASVPGSAAEALQKHEATKMSRRAVLSKVGLQFGAAAILALSVDDLARKVTATIAARNKDNEVAQAVANEFKNAGIAFADNTDTSSVGCADQAGYCENRQACADACVACKKLAGGDLDKAVACAVEKSRCISKVKDDNPGCCCDVKCPGNKESCEYYPDPW